MALIRKEASVASSRGFRTFRNRKARACQAVNGNSKEEAEILNVEISVRKKVRGTVFF